MIAIRILAGLILGLSLTAPGLAHKRYNLGTGILLPRRGSPRRRSAQCPSGRWRRRGFGRHAEPRIRQHHRERSPTGDRRLGLVGTDSSRRRVRDRMRQCPVLVGGNGTRWRESNYRLVCSGTEPFWSRVWAETRWSTPPADDS